MPARKNAASSDAATPPKAKIPPKATGPGTALAKKQATDIATIQEALKAQAAEISERTQPATGNKIQLSNSKTFELPDGTKTDGPLELVIVDFVSKNMFYTSDYDPKEITPPACFAIGIKPTQLAPSNNSPVKQSAECSGCPMNQFGTDKRGTGKACKNTRWLAVLPPDADENTPIWFLSVSPTALKGFDGYVSSIARQFNMPPISVVTSVSFDQNADYAKLVFGDPQPNENLAVHFARQVEARELLMQEPDVSGYVEDKPPARKAVAKTARR